MPLRYSSVAIALHWVIALLIVGQLAGGFYMHGLPDADAERKFQLYQLHKSFGLTVLLLTAFRLFWRLTHAAPPLPAGMASWERAAARGVHIFFYVFLFLTPLFGWAVASSSSSGIPTMVFGLFEWPHLPISRSEEAYELSKELHEIAAKLIIALLFVHVAAALKHQFLNRDGVLARMLPFMRGKP